MPEKYNGALGSAGSLRGTTLLISIFTNDAQTAWDDEADREEMLLTLNRMDTAAQWLTEQAAVHMARTLRSSMTGPLIRTCAMMPRFRSFSSARMGACMRCRPPIMYGENIDSDALRQKYHADNVVYFFPVQHAL